MALVDMRDLLAEARAGGHAVAGFAPATIDALDAVLTAAERLDAPLVLTVAAAHLQQGRSGRLRLVAMHAAARETAVPVALCLDGSVDPVVISEAIRLGCNAVRVTANVSDAILTTLRQCGVTIIDSDDDGLVEQASGDITTDAAVQCLTQSGSAGRGMAMRAACRPWAPVEHVIVYNVEGDDPQAVEAMMATGRRQLGAIPGVLDVFTGTALTANPKYRHCWLVRFTHPAVIRSYAEHPDHVAFADTLFRPIAGDRITIDYQAVESEPPAVPRAGRRQDS